MPIADLGKREIAYNAMSASYVYNATEGLLFKDIV
jgi:hypothetical protein